MTKKLNAIDGTEILVDAEDFDELSEARWTISGRENGRVGYANSTWYSKFGRMDFKMHRTLMGATSGELVDHINGNSLDNRKSNLRICSKSENAMNASKRKRSSSSKYKGVSFLKLHKKWEAYICPKGKKIFLGNYSTEDEAAIAYNEAAKKHFGEFAKLNEV